MLTPTHRGRAALKEALGGEKPPFSFSPETLDQVLALPRPTMQITNLVGKNPDQINQLLMWGLASNLLRGGVRYGVASKDPEGNHISMKYLPREIAYNFLFPNINSLD
ncbi:hypothetical protein HZA75_01560 [Candidatus Roizmanbacteria bacterium]|nr:hypothetical protein [Candidatus Roizmanbacteria bacterium]